MPLLLALEPELVAFLVFARVVDFVALAADLVFLAAVVARDEVAFFDVAVFFGAAFAFDAVEVLLAPVAALALVAVLLFAVDFFAVAVVLAFAVVLRALVFAVVHVHAKPNH